MKERPILFSGPMVRAILEGRKTQTRRVVKNAMAIEDIERMATCHPILGDAKHVGGMQIDREMVGCSCGGELTETDIVRLWCRYGVPGDRLCVKETWQYGPDVTPGMMAGGKMSRRHIVYAATVADGSHPPTWRPSIHMPRWASRLTLEITDVRVERLQEITLADCAAEGAPPTHPADNVWDSTDTYRTLWESINGRGSWDANPWVWVIEFKKVEAANGDH